MGAGRPTDYRVDYNEQAYKLCLLGHTDAELATFFEVEESTINNWKTKHPEFLESIRNGKGIADMDVAHGLFSGTKDRVVVEQQAIKIKSTSYDDRGKKIEKEEVIIVDIEKVIPADFRNQQFWLKNRKSNAWRDKQETGFTDNDGKDINLAPQINVYNSAPPMASSEAEID